MAGKQAKLLCASEVAKLLKKVRYGRHSERDRVILLLSLKAGLRAGEIAKLTWPMVLTPSGQVSGAIELYDSVAKRGGGRTIPLHPELRKALVKLQPSKRFDGPVVRSERGGYMKPTSIVNWFAQLYQKLGLEGCSSHSGRRTFITHAARNVHRVGGSLRDVQQLAGHRSIVMTQRYIEGDTKAQRALVRII